MKELVIEITETLQRQVKVKANSKCEAYYAVRQRYKDGEIVLDSTDFIEVKFNVIDEEEIYD